ncbi:hypothetical protein RMATCC62417_14346 [Rhizopus microsporus]|nr:hypothetical protein RMATCC62417_14346 [Rhizopus microsporus]
MMKPKLQQKIRSIKKIEPTLLKTSSRSDESSTSSDDEIGDTSYYNYRLRRYNSSHAKQRKNSCDWEAESADSDALVQHIIRVSKDRNTINHASSSNSNNNNSSSSSRSNNNNNNNNSTIHWNTDDIDQDYIPSKSDYDYEFDDDDWDTHSEHIDDAPSFTAQKKRSNSISSNHTHSTSSSTSSSSSSILNNIVRWASNHLWSSSDNEDK